MQSSETLPAGRQASNERPARERVGLALDETEAATAAVEHIRAAEVAGVRQVWMGQPPTGPDTLTVLAAAAVRTTTIRLGTAIVPTYPRHPLALAQQALALFDVAPERLRLGVGPSHLPFIEGIYGLPMPSPLAHLREYVTVLRAASIFPCSPSSLACTFASSAAARSRLPSASATAGLRVIYTTASATIFHTFPSSTYPSTPSALMGKGWQGTPHGERQRVHEESPARRCPRCADPSHCGEPRNRTPPHASTAAPPSCGSSADRSRQSWPRPRRSAPPAPARRADRARHREPSLRVARHCWLPSLGLLISPSRPCWWVPSLLSIPWGQHLRRAHLERAHPLQPVSHARQRVSNGFEIPAGDAFIVAEASVTSDVCIHANMW
jgi:hypothetical protein